MATTKQQQKELNATFWAYRRGERRHVRVGQRAQDGTTITLLGTAQQLHGPDGVCTCCPRGLRRSA